MSRILKVDYRVRCDECEWTGYRRQASPGNAELDSCPRCAACAIAVIGVRHWRIQQAERSAG